MTVCCVENCGLTTDDVILFEFPRSRLLRRRWLEAIEAGAGAVAGAGAGEGADDARVCIKHFTRTDYEHVRGETRLKMRVVPTVFRHQMKTSKKEVNTQKDEKQSENKDEDSEKSNNDSEKTKCQKESCGKVGMDQHDNYNGNSVKEGGLDDTTNSKRKNSSVKADKPRKRTAIWNGHISTSSLDSNNSQSNANRSNSPVSVTGDIEELLTNYQIENKKTERQIAAMAEEFFAMQAENAPVFIEMEVGQGTQDASTDDCLMLLEKVQVDVDPALLLADDDCCEHINITDNDDNDRTTQPNSKEDPISLLTSSDEDEVIIEEPHIDTVEVSDETDEDDVPLVKLKQVQAEKKLSKKGKKKIKQELEDVVWVGEDYYCYQCRFTTSDRTEHKKHLERHSKVIQVCQECGFTTCSKQQLYRHRRKHKSEKKHKCPLCKYSARHTMSLTYHLRTHDSGCGGGESERCRYMTAVGVEGGEGEGQYRCVYCEYCTKRRSELGRHLARSHNHHHDHNYSTDGDGDGDGDGDDASSNNNNN